MKEKLKTHKALDLKGWKYEMVLYAGKDLEKSIKMMINTMFQLKVIPDAWNKMVIQPIDKKAGWLEMTDKRGLFLTNIISKCIERIIFTRSEEF